MAEISVILPSRGRPDRLKKMYASLVKNAIKPSRMEIMVAVDEDDEKMTNFPALKYMSMFRTLRRRSIADYQNWLWAKSSGDFFFILNDDVEVVTKGWDEIIVKRMSPLSYGLTSPCPYYSEFPVIGKLGAERLGYLMPPQFRSHGADSHIYRVFLNAKLIVDLRDLSIYHKLVYDDTRSHVVKISDDRYENPEYESTRLIHPRIKMI